MRSSGLQTLLKDLEPPRCHKQREPDYSRSVKRGFLEYFNIISVGRAEALGRRECGEQVVCDVIVLDDSDEDDPEVEEQLSSKSLRGLIPSDSKNFKRSSSIVVKRCNDTIATSHSAQKLLRIDVFSPLGQRLRDHVGTLSNNKSEPHESESKRLLSNGNVIPNNATVCCASTFARETPFNDRLRQPSDYRITFRPTRQQCRSSYSHAYKFTSRQRKEFCRAFDCGLNARSRRLLRRLKPCVVKAPKLPLTTSGTKCSSMLESELMLDQHRLVLRRTRKSAALLTEGNMLDDDRCNVNRSKMISLQMVSDFSSSECNTQETTCVRSTPESDQCHSLDEASSTVTSDSVVTANEHIVEMGQESLPVSPAVDAVGNLPTEKSDLPSISDTSVCNDSKENSDSSSGHDACVVTDGHNCLDLSPISAESSGVVLDPTTSVSTMETDIQTSDNDSQTANSGVDCGNCGWSMSGDLPALSFFCNICGDVVDCERDSKSLILDHYAGHGITNIELMDETAPTGEKVIKLIELPGVKANTSKTIHSEATILPTAAGEKSSTNSILVQRHSYCQTEGVEFGVSSTASSVRTQKKQRRVTWADQVCTTTTQQPQHVLPPLCTDRAQQDSAIGASKQQFTSYLGQQTMTENNDCVEPALCSNNNLAISPPVAVESTNHTVVGANMSSNTVLPVDESIPCSFPLTNSSDRVLSAVRYPINVAKTASRRARTFWSNSSLAGASMCGGSLLVTEHPYASHAGTPASTALPLRSKRAADDVLFPSPRTEAVRPTLSSCRQSYQQETNVICID